MAGNVVSLNKKKNENTSEKVEGFVTRNRKVILICVAVVVVAAIVVGVIFGVSESNTKKVLSAIDEIEYTYTNESSDLDADAVAARENAALASLDAYLGKSGVAGVRANMLAASINYEKADFEAAAAEYEKAAVLSKKNYTAAINWFNAGAAYEDAGNAEEALKCYTKASEVPFDMTANALFNAARLNEEAGNADEAVKLYTKITEDYSSDNWANLAQSRLIVLGAN